MFPNRVIVYKETKRSTERRFLGDVQKGHWASEKKDYTWGALNVETGVRRQRSLKRWSKSSALVVEGLLCSQFLSVSIHERSLGNVMGEKQQSMVNCGRSISCLSVTGSHEGEIKVLRSVFLK